MRQVQRGCRKVAGRRPVWFNGQHVLTGCKSRTEARRPRGNTHGSGRNPLIVGENRSAPPPPTGYTVSVDHDPLGRLRDLCLALPETTERLSHGEPTWFVRGKKTFVTYADHHHDDRLAFWCAAPPGAQELLVAADPERYFVPPYVGGRGWLGVRLDMPVDWDEIAEIVIAAYRQVAPKTLLKQLDSSVPPNPRAAPSD